MYLLYLKSFHIIGVIVWFAGLFYLGRLFVYHKEAETLPKTECESFKKQYSKMEKRLYYGIAWPGLCITIIFGIAMLIDWGMPNWIQLKFTLVILLVVYHFWCGHLRKKLFNNKCNWNSKHFRFFNEIPTVLLISTVFLVVFKENITWTIFLVLTIPLSLMIFFTIHILSIKEKNKK